MPKETILIVDDEESIRKSLSGVLADEGYEVATAATGKEALDLLGEAQPALALLDIRMPEMDGIETLRRFKELRPEMQVIMITGHGEIEDAVKTIKLGAYDFIRKPLSISDVTLAVQHGLEDYRLRRENESLRQSIEKRYELVGESPKVRELK